MSLRSSGTDFHSVSWLSKKQPLVSLSTVEAEYVALSRVTQEATWIRRLLSDFNVPQDIPTVLMEDNHGAVHIARNPVVQARTKHIDICYHYIREALIDGTIDLRHCPTQDMIADIFTKPLTKKRFENLREKVGLSAD